MSNLHNAINKHQLPSPSHNLPVHRFHVPNKKTNPSPHNNIICLNNNINSIGLDNIF